MFAITPQLCDDYDFLQLADELTRRPFIINVNGPRELMRRNFPSLAGLRESEVHNTDKEFRVCLDLHNFKPEEVKITSNNKCIRITADHEEKQDKHGYVSRKMTRVYTLPEDVDPKSVTSAMNSHGVLNIKASKQELEAPKETVIAVEFKN